MNDNDTDTAAEVRAWRRALAALPPAQRAMVERMHRVMGAALAAPARAAQPLQLVPVAGADGETSDEVARAAARRILARHGRGGRGGDGAA